MADLSLQQEAVPYPGNSGKMLVRFAILGAVVAMALGYMVYAALNNDLWSLSVTEFTNKEDAQDGRMVRVWGKLVEGSFERQGSSTISSFRLHDDESGAQLAATYEGVLPTCSSTPIQRSFLKAATAPTTCSRPITSWSNARPSTKGWRARPLTRATSRPSPVSHSHLSSTE